jgi:PKD repeat protein
MNTEIIAQVNTKFDYSEEYREWLQEKYPNSYQDSLKKHQRFLMEHTNVWDEALASTIESEVQDYLQTLELDAEVSVEITKSEHKEGSLITFVTVLIVVEILSEIAKNISEVVKNIIETRGKETFSEKINEAGRDILCDNFYQGSCPNNMPINIFNVDNWNNITVNIQNNIYNN